MDAAPRKGKCDMTGCTTLYGEFDAVVDRLGDVVAKIKPYEEPIPGGRPDSESDGGEADEQTEEERPPRRTVDHSSWR